MSDRWRNSNPTIVLIVVAVGLGAAVFFCLVAAMFVLPVYQRSREAARRQQVRDNLDQIEGAIEGYHRRRVARSRTESQKMTLADALAVIQSKQFIDLTHAFEPGIARWPGFPDEQRETLYWFDEGKGTMGSGFFAQKYTLVGQWGTHCDPPVHFAEGNRSMDQIDVREMILPLVVIDVHEKVAENLDYAITMDDVRAWESQYGLVPQGTFVAMRTDWSKRWPDPEAMRNCDEAGIAHFPGWSLEVLRYLYEQRGITASGHETTDTDGGIATSKGDYSLESYILSQDKYQIELLTNLDQVSETGSVVVATFPKPKGGSGFPARVFAILP